MFQIVKDPEYLSGILPIAQSTGWFLPGGGKKKPDCDKIRAMICDHYHSHPEEKVFVRLYKRRCLDKKCPVCFEAWATRESESVLSRLASYSRGYKDVKDFIRRTKRKLRGSRPKKIHRALVMGLEDMLQNPTQGRGKPIHVIISPPPKTEFDKANYPRLRRKCYKIARSIGLHAGAVIFHPYRLKCRFCGGTIPDYHKACPECGNRKVWWRPSPHFHIICFGWTSKIKDAFARFGWIMKNVGVRKSVFWTAQYLLSHAGVFVDQDEKRYRERKFHVVTWFGNLSYNSRMPCAKIGHVYNVCPYCFAPLVPGVFIGGLDKPPPDFDEKDGDQNDFIDDKARWSRL